MLNKWLAGSDAAAVKSLVAKLSGTELGSLDARLKWFKADRAAFEASSDPAIQYAVAVMPALLKQEEQKKIREGESLTARPLYLQAVADYKKSQGEFVYPDANLSLRITFGNVMGYGKDGVKYTRSPPWKAWQRRKPVKIRSIRRRRCSMRSRPSVTAAWKTSALVRCR